MTRREKWGWWILMFYGVLMGMGLGAVATDRWTVLAGVAATSLVLGAALTIMLMAMADARPGTDDGDGGERASPMDWGPVLTTAFEQHLVSGETFSDRQQRQSDWSRHRLPPIHRPRVVTTSEVTQ